MSRSVAWDLPEPSGARRQPVRFGYEVLRGIAQVDFMPNAACGLFFVAALFAAGWRYGLAGLLGTALGTATAHALGVDRERTAAGLEGFNGCLVAVAFAVFLGPGHASTWLMAAGGAVVASVLTAALVNLLRPWSIPTFTLPFCLVAGVVTVAAPGFQRVWHEGSSLSALPRSASGDASLGLGDAAHAVLANVGQIFLMPQWYVGLLFLAGIFVADWFAGLTACLGSVVGTATSWALGAPASDVAEGLLGYNAVLVAMALGAVFLERGVAALVYGVVGAVASTVLTVAVTSFFAPFGGHTLTWPYVLTTLFFLAAVPSFPRLRRA
ncbi:urea transporter [Streptomyces reniochalinae]|uniref:Urea transporter n=1 Tax=Streptomyces reniochalinae TaxID=2250578 RepID=A0A367EEL4_9ACTN|nr:urea transporter [Streptomyces reniochalinae]RCG16508.1 urea transporter [Streptomyces reniochalinae]